MAKLFSEEWGEAFSAGWNADKDMVRGLAAEGFCANIAYGIDGEPSPRIVITVDNGRVVNASPFVGQPVNWDLRASLDNWRRWMIEGFGLANLGTAVAMKKLRFEQGDYRQMIRNPGLAKPFLRHFEVMSRVKTDYS
ncbi:MAG: SCP-2 sterol transfer family protein [Gammaproteobacteria bacterium]|nr:SCP-2 sterol transfer family protein [Gammaproteobacteria bacterium]